MTIRELIPRRLKGLPPGQRDDTLINVAARRPVNA